MDSIVAQVHALAQSADDDGQLKIKQIIRRLDLDLRGPQDILFDMANSVRDGLFKLIPVADFHRTFSLV